MRTNLLIAFVLAPEYCRRHGLDQKKLLREASERAEAILREMEQELDYGPEDNPMSFNMALASSLFAFYDAVDRKLTSDEALEIIRDRLPSRIPLISSQINRHFPSLAERYLAHGRKLRKTISEHQEKGEWLDAWSIQEGVPGDQRALGEEGKSLSFTFTSCPIAKFAREHGYTDIVAAACMSDYLTAGLLGLDLIRPHTIAEGFDSCPYTYVPADLKSKKERLTVEKDGFHGVYWPDPLGSRSVIIAMIGDDAEDYLARSFALWFQKKGFNVLTMSPGKKDYGHHNYPLERFEAAIAFLKERGNVRIGIAGASTSGMLALTAASFFPDITFTLAVSPSDFVMEGFYRDGKDGMKERPGDHESSISYRGEPLPYLPYAYRHPEYWEKIREESRRRGAIAASRDLFDESERRHPLREEEKIRLEKIKGRVLLIGAEDDVLWDTARYIRRMKARLKIYPHENSTRALIYRHGTHFLYPESMLRQLLPLGSGLFISFCFQEARKYPKKCRAARMDVDQKISEELRRWKRKGAS